MNAASSWRRTPSKAMTESSALSQLCLRPFDVGVALRLLLAPEERYEPLAHALATSTSAVHRSVTRLRIARICKPESRTIDQPTFIEFAVCGVPYTFPAIRLGNGRGLLAASSHPDLAHVRNESGDAVVWASSKHQDSGQTLVPLFPGVVQVAARDGRMYRLLAIIDALRIAHRDERAPWRECLEEMLSAAV